MKRTSKRTGAKTLPGRRGKADAEHSKATTDDFDREEMGVARKE